MLKWTAAAVLAVAVAIEAGAAAAPSAAPLRLRRGLAGQLVRPRLLARGLRPLRPLRGGGGQDGAVGAPVTVTFVVECQETTVEESIGILGSCAELGNWRDVVVMSPQEWPRWSLEVPMHELHHDVEYKFVKMRKDGEITRWERGHNRKMSLENPAAKDLFIDGGHFGEGAAYDRQPVRKPANLVPGCVARVASQAKMAAMAAEATLAETAAAQSLDGGVEKTAADLEDDEAEDEPEAAEKKQAPPPPPRRSPTKQLVPGCREEAKEFEADEAAAAAATQSKEVADNKVKQMVPGCKGAQAPAAENAEKASEQDETPQPTTDTSHPRQLVPGASAPPAEMKKAQAPPPPRRSPTKQLVPGCKEVSV